MAEVKKTKKSTASKKNVAKKDEAPVIKKIIPETIDDLKIEDKYEGESDNKAIIFIAVAILIVVGTIVGLIVGCEKKEETPEKPNDEVVVPEDKDDDVSEQEEEEDVVSKVVKKTTVKKEQPEKYYEVLFLEQYGSDEDIYVLNTYRTEVRHGNKVHKYTPNGLTCTYYTNPGFTSKYNFNTKITKDTVIYMNCTEVSYMVNFVNSEVEGFEYYLSKGDYELPVPAAEENKIFLGWFTNPDFTGNRIVSINVDNVKDLADKNRNINLYAKFGDPIKVVYNAVYDDPSTLDVVEESFVLETVEISDEASLENYVLETFDNACPANSSFKGYKTSIDSKVSTFNGEIKNIRDKGPVLELYANCGTYSVAYEGGDKVVFDEPEDFTLAVDPADVNVPNQTYFDKVDNMSESAYLVVSNDEETLEENEIRLADVELNCAKDYTPKVGDYVIMKNKVFVGWIIAEDDEVVEEEPTVEPEETTEPETQEEITEPEVTEPGSEEETTDPVVGVDVPFENTDQVLDYMEENGITDVTLEGVWVEEDEVIASEPTEPEVTTEEAETETTVEVVETETVEEVEETVEVETEEVL